MTTQPNISKYHMGGNYSLRAEEGVLVIVPNNPLSRMAIRLNLDSLVINKLDIEIPEPEVYQHRSGPFGEVTQEVVTGVYPPKFLMEIEGLPNMSVGEVADADSGLSVVLGVRQTSAEQIRRIRFDSRD